MSDSSQLQFRGTSDTAFGWPYFWPTPVADFLGDAVAQAANTIIPTLLPPLIAPAVNTAVNALAVRRVGDTLTGALFANALLPLPSPLGDYQLVTKAYVDMMTAGSGLPEVPAAPAGEIWGRITGSWVPISADLSGGGIAEPTAAGNWLRTNTGTWVQGLPLTGGTVTGPVIARYFEAPFPGGFAINCLIDAANDWHYVNAGKAGVLMGTDTFAVPYMAVAPTGAAGALIVPGTWAQIFTFDEDRCIASGHGIAYGPATSPGNAIAFSYVPAVNTLQYHVDGALAGAMVFSTANYFELQWTGTEARLLVNGTDVGSITLGP